MELTSEAFLRRKTEGNMTMDTVCHNPAQRLNGLMLDDYNSSRCEMRERKGMGSIFFICSCSMDECNDSVVFTHSKCCVVMMRHQDDIRSLSRQGCVQDYCVVVTACYADSCVVLCYAMLCSVMLCRATLLHAM